LDRYESSDDELDDETSSKVLDETGQLLHDGFLLTVAASCVLIKKLALRHDLMKAAIGDIYYSKFECIAPNQTTVLLLCTALTSSWVIIEIPVEQQLQTLLESKLMLQLSAAAIS